MLKKTVSIIHKLRIYFLVFIAVAFFYQLGINPVNVGRFFGAKLGKAIGMSTSIPENPFNKLAAQLQDKEDKLNSREDELSRREKALNQPKEEEPDWMIIILAGGISLLFVLVVVNYYLDFRRKKKN